MFGEEPAKFLDNRFRIISGDEGVGDYNSHVELKIAKWHVTPLAEHFTLKNTLDPQTAPVLTRDIIISTRR